VKYVEAGGVRVSAIGLGTWQFASREWAYGDDYAQTTAPALVRRALELGVTLIDTAEAYGGGGSELVVGSALRTIEQLEENVRAADLELSAPERDHLTAASVALAGRRRRGPRAGV
jgi:aryl-alcohol dehydrogenase-like predicted oxidoreductase